MTQAEFLRWFGQWKDVVTTAVALVAILVVVVQILQAGRFEKNRLRREQVAARATLPLTLNALTEYGQDMLRALAPLERWLEQRQEGDPPIFNGPRMPADTILAVEKVVAAYPKDNVAKALAAVVSEVQVLEARSRDYSSKEESVRSWSIAMKDNLVMAASIVARCQDLFVFARKGTDYGEPTRSHLQQVLTWAQVYQDPYPRVWKSTARFADDPKPTWRQRRLLSKIPGLFRRS
jgi:hypothetical protein